MTEPLDLDAFERALTDVHRSLTQVFEQAQQKYFAAKTEHDTASNSLVEFRNKYGVILSSMENRAAAAQVGSTAGSAEVRS